MIDNDKEYYFNLFEIALAENAYRLTIMGVDIQLSGEKICWPTLFEIEWLSENYNGCGGCLHIEFLFCVIYDTQDPVFWQKWFKKDQDVE